MGTTSYASTQEIHDHKKVLADKGMTPDPHVDQLRT